MKTYEKLDSNTLKITDEVIVKQAVSTYVYDDLARAVEVLKAQRADIDQKIAEAEALVAEADALGIVAINNPSEVI